MGGHFRHNVWDPALIIFQIISMQCLFYVSLGICLTSLDLLTDSQKSLNQIFKYDEIRFKDSGLLLVLGFIINAFICSLGLWSIVEKTKQCLDFTVTLYLFHWLLSWHYNHQLASSYSWWTLQFICITITCVCGEFLCMRTEMKSIPLSLGVKTDL